MSVLANASLFIDLGAVQENARQIQQEIGPRSRLVPVLKGDAYGLGALKVAEALSRLEGIDSFAVAHVQEALALREAGFSQKILLLSMPPEAHWPEAAQADLTLPLIRLDQIPTLCELSRKLDRPVRVSLALDTGLNRIGFRPEELEALCAALLETRGLLRLEGTYSHFAGRDLDFSREQEAKYRCFLDQLRASGIHPGLKHMGSSASLEEGLALNLDAFRVGRRLFLDSPDHPSGNIREAFSLRAYLTNIRERKAGERLGYGGKKLLARDTRVGVISIGYGDGLDPALAEANAPVLIRGRRAPLLSCFMDQSLVDLGELPAEPGDPVTLFGFDKSGNLLSSQEVAGLLGWEGVDLTARLTSRVARVWLPARE